MQTLKQDYLISELYAAASGRVDWSMALRQLAEHLDLWVVQLLCVDVSKGNLIFTAYGGAGGSPSALDYVRFYNTIDPRPALALQATADEWINSEEHHDEAFVATDPYYRDFLTPNGGGHVVGTKVLQTGNALFMLAMVQRHGVRSITAEQRPFLWQLKHHLCEALRNMTHLREAYAELGMARELLDRFDYPMLLIDEYRGLLHSNTSAVIFLQQQQMISDRGGHLVCRNKAEDVALTEAIHSLDLSLNGRDSAPKRRVVTLSKPDGTACLAFISAVRPEQTMGVFGHSASVLVLLHDPATSNSQLDPFIIAECFDLTPAEAHVAVKIASGASPKEVAQRIGIALPTVRTHLSRVMEKIGVSRQADLVRVLLSLPSRA